jgi:hypothetical protein
MVTLSRPDEEFITLLSGPKYTRLGLVHLLVHIGPPTRRAIRRANLGITTLTRPANNSSLVPLPFTLWRVYGVHRPAISVVLIGGRCGLVLPLAKTVVAPDYTRERENERDAT